MNKTKKSFPGTLKQKKISGEVEKTARTEQNPVNNMIIALNLQPIASDIATELSPLKR